MSITFWSSVTGFPSLYSAFAGNSISDSETPNSTKSNFSLSIEVQAARAHTTQATVDILMIELGFMSVIYCI